MKYGLKIKMIRLLKNVSAKEIYMELNMSQSNYNKLEREKITLSEEHLALIANKLGVSPDYIKNFKEEDFLVSGHNNHQEENANYEVYHLPLQLVDMLQSALNIMQEENTYLREQNQKLIEKLLQSA